MQALADAVLLLHLAVVLFVVSGPPLIALGNRWGWQWVNRPAYRVAHLLLIAVVVAQAWLGALCPLTTLEVWLRRQGGGAGYEGSFIQQGVRALIYHEAPMWVFAVVYTVFAGIVVLLWWRYPPTRGRSGRQSLRRPLSQPR
ncbi:DUF2784 domain-containing protein [Sediminicurvatus halobius]|uniref:DUF2784 domain-containing protein n=1 Tax=Sediminicurvatus halobius TaxID=2182432 RepID=A0A2U2N3X3_9GAMM|nr:DUF2784 domain-containing protein [Spiribacter halobius]PWG63876.1 DUF2784 domain-containing protein [Spiribacter halobius]UEX76284.1 DUF2784 domain-containing protein [Spiribacter halobius]